MFAEVAAQVDSFNFQKIVASIRDYAIFILDLDGTILTWNEGAQIIKGYKPDEVIGRSFEIFYSEEDRRRGHPAEELLCAMRFSRYEEEGWRLRKSGERFWARVTITRLDDNQGNPIGFSKITRDLTLKKLAEENLKSLNETLEERVRVRTHDLELSLKARDEFMSIASHELRTPLTTLRLRQQILLRDLKKGRKQGLTAEEAIEEISQAEQQIRHLERLIEDILIVSRTGPSPIELYPSRVNLMAVMREELTELARFMDFTLDQFEFSGDVGTEIVADRERIAQIFRNLFGNALKFGHPGSHVQIAIHASDKDVSIRVKSFGEIIAPEDRTRVFERFERASDGTKISGLGLGLPISRILTEAHGGRLSLETTHDANVFVVTLPLDVR